MLAAAARRVQIARVSPMMGAPRAPYALEPTAFPLPALAAMAGRAPLGGPREIALACFLVGRLVVDRAGDLEGGALSSEQRRTRALGARQWLGSATVPGAVRTALAKLADASAGNDPAAIHTALNSVMAVTANHLDQGARLELGRLAQTIAE